MFFRLIRDYSRDSQAGIALMTVLLLPIFMIVIFASYDFGRLFMMTRFVSTVAQQTVEWVAVRGMGPTEDPDVLAKQAFDKRMGKNIIPSFALYSGITSTNLTFTYDQSTGVSSLVAIANYNMALRKLLKLSSMPIAADARFKLRTVYITVVFSAGEMRSEGNSIYGTGQTGQPEYNRGVSWSNRYYTDIVGKPVDTRTTPTHNFYMTAALIKELMSKFQFRKRYVSIIPVSATINLNPWSSSASIPGSDEGTLPRWIFSDGNVIDVTSYTPKTSAICITNRSLPMPNNIPNDQIISYYQDYRRIPGRTIRRNASYYPDNYFTPDVLLKDSSHAFTIDGIYATDRGYPYSPLNNGFCPATNTAPALASFQEVTTANYQVANTPDDNKRFWAYMENFIDPAKKIPNNSPYAIWGSPNMVFGLQIAFENIAELIDNKRIKDSSTDVYNDGEFLVYVVSDQIGGVKNASGAPFSMLNTNADLRWPFYNSCINGNTIDTDPYHCSTNGKKSGRGYPLLQLPSNKSTWATPFAFNFSHFWWDSAYNPTAPNCIAAWIMDSKTCDIAYSALPHETVHNFSNIINYAIDMKINRFSQKIFSKPSVFFIDTGSGKRSDFCDASNEKLIIDSGSLPYFYSPYGLPKPCQAYAELSGYKVTSKFPSSPPYVEGGVGAGIGYIDWGPEDQTSTGFRKVFSYKSTDPDMIEALQDYPDKYLPMYFYNNVSKLQVNSNPLAASVDYNATINNVTRAAAIAKFVVSESVINP